MKPPRHEHLSYPDANMTPIPTITRLLNMIEPYIERDDAIALLEYLNSLLPQLLTMSTIEQDEWLIRQLQAIDPDKAVTAVVIATPDTHRETTVGNEALTSFFRYWREVILSERYQPSDTISLSSLFLHLGVSKREARVLLLGNVDLIPTQVMSDLIGISGTETLEHALALVRSHVLTSPVPYLRQLREEAIKKKRDVIADFLRDAIAEISGFAPRPSHIRRVTLPFMLDPSSVMRFPNASEDRASLDQETEDVPNSLSPHHTPASLRPAPFGRYDSPRRRSPIPDLLPSHDSSHQASGPRSPIPDLLPRRSSSPQRQSPIPDLLPSRDNFPQPGRNSSPPRRLDESDVLSHPLPPRRLPTHQELVDALPQFDRAHLLRWLMSTMVPPEGEELMRQYLDTQATAQEKEALYVDATRMLMARSAEHLLVYGPINSMVGESISDDKECLETGGCRMLLCRCYDRLDEDDDESDWYTGACEKCSLRIAKRWYAVRVPVEGGGWRGTFCSWECAAEADDVGDYPRYFVADRRD
jgi:hypothetical protein